MKQSETIVVSLPPNARRKLARISQKSGISPVTIIRYAVKKQLPLWEGDGDEIAAIASRMICKPENDASLVRKKPKT